MQLAIKTTLLELKLNFRNFLTVFFTMIFPVVMLLLFGSIYGNDPSDFYGGYGAVDMLAPGYINMIILVSGIMTLPMTLSQYRERKILKRFMATPIRPLDILLAQISVNLIMTLLSSIILIVTGIIVFDLHFFGNVFITMMVMLLIIIAVFNMGLFIAGFSKNAKTTVAIANVVYFVMLFLSGVTMPLEFMPEGVAKFAEFLPVKHGIELLRAAWLGKPMGDYIMEIIILVGVALVFGFLSLKSFKWE